MNLKTTIVAATAALTLTGVAVSAEKSGQVVTLDLKGAVGGALAESTEIKAARSDYHSAAGAAEAARGVFFPQVRGEIEAGTLRDRVMTPGETVRPEVARDRNQYQGRIVLEQNIFNGFGDIAGYRSASAEAARRWESLQEKRLNLTRTVVELYFGIQLDQRKLRAEREVRELRAKQLKEVRSRLRAGRATELDRLQAEYSYTSQLPEISRLVAELQTKTLRLVRLLGLPIDSRIKLSDSLETAHSVLGRESLPPLADAYKRALAGNHELAALERQLEKVRHDYRRIRAQHLPSASLVLKAGTDAHLREEIMDSDSQSMSGMVKISIPLFSGLDSFGEAREAKAAEMKVRYDQTLKRETLFERLMAIYANMRLADERIKAEKVNLKLAKETVQKAETQYRTGQARLSDVLDGYAFRLKADRQLAEAIFDRILTTIQIQELMGVGTGNKQTEQKEESS